MNTGILRSRYKRVWPQFYKAALFELDASKVSDRIAEAEAALGIRARELFHAVGDNTEEEQAVDDATYALHALRSALKCGQKKTASPPSKTGVAQEVGARVEKEHLDERS